MSKDMIPVLYYTDAYDEGGPAVHKIVFRDVLLQWYPFEGEVKRMAEAKRKRGERFKYVNAFTMGTIAENIWCD